jgi:hypothetical protein
MSRFGNPHSKDADLRSVTYVCNWPFATVGAAQRYVRSWMNSGSGWTALEAPNLWYRARRSTSMRELADPPRWARRQVFISLWRTSIGNNVRRAGSSSPPRPCCHFALQHGPTPNIARSFFAGSESHLAGVGTWAISSALAELQTGALAQLSFCYLAFLALRLGRVSFVRLRQLGCRLR